jgi:hypothetical protein
MLQISISRRHAAPASAIRSDDLSEPMRSRHSDPRQRLRRMSGTILFRLLASLPLVAGSLAPTTADAWVGISLSVGFAPPALPVYDQPPIPGPGFLWTPGYWAYGPGGYYWVPGTWVRPPTIGLLWTPGYWGWSGGLFVWHAGYWGPHIGFYGGVNYGFGYVGLGYVGGYWNHGVFTYNSAVNNIRNVNITNVYNKTVINNGPATNASYNGGTGGTTARPTPQEEAKRPELLASNNHGRPAPSVAAVSHPGAFGGHPGGSQPGGPHPGGPAGHGMPGPHQGPHPAMANLRPGPQHAHPPGGNGPGGHGGSPHPANPHPRPAAVQHQNGHPNHHPG